MGSLKTRKQEGEGGEAAASMEKAEKKGEWWAKGWGSSSLVNRPQAARDARAGSKEDEDGC